MKTAIICGFLALLACNVSAGGTKRLAERGDARAQYELARRCSEKKDYRCAVAWFRKAAEQGHAGAQNRLGVMYERGEGVGIDELEALKWYSLAASAQNAYAIANRISLERRLTTEPLAAAQARLPVDGVASLAKSSDTK